MGLKSVGDFVCDTTAASSAHSFALAANGLDEFLVIIDVAVKGPQSRTRAQLSSKDVGLDPPGKNSPHLMAHECPGGDGKDVVEFLLLQCQLR